MAPPVGWMLGCGWLFSCSAIFGIDASDRRDESELAGAAGADPGSGGRSTGGGTTGGGATGGSDTGGQTGKGGEGGGGAGGNQPGTAGQPPGGAGGEGGSEDRGAILGEPCTGDETESNSACTIGSPHLVLTCQMGVWNVDEECGTYEFCVPEKSRNEPAACVDISPLCRASYTSACTGGNRLIDCESFRPEAYLRYCPFGCEDGACLPGSGDQLIVHTGTGNGVVPPRTIPVCVLDANESGDVDLVAWIRDEVEHTWARTLDYSFEGWEACDGTLPDAGVVLSFESACSGHLANDIDPRSPLFRLEICRSFHLEGDEPGDEPRAVEEPLARFLGRHHFGHVLGVADSDYRGEQTTAMVRGIELSRVGEYELSPAERYSAIYRCGQSCRKHSGALVTPLGRCLEVASDGTIVAQACSAAGGPQDFTLRMTELFAVAPDRCVGTSGAGQPTDVLAGECATLDEHFALTGAALRSLGRCATPASFPPSAGTSLWFGACDAVPESWTGWSFEVTAANANGLLARIRHDDLYVSVPGGVDALRLVPELRPRGADNEQIFELKWDGVIGFGSRCLSWGEAVGDPAEGSVYLGDECGGVNGDHWTVTGALTTASGLALKLAPGDVRATATEVQGTPSEAQTFDFYF